MCGRTVNRGFVHETLCVLERWKSKTTAEMVVLMPRSLATRVLLERMNKELWWASLWWQSRVLCCGAALKHTRSRAVQ